MLDQLEKPAAARRPMPRRYRRIIWTASALCTVALIGAIVAWRIHKDNEPEEYVPGETSSDVTSVIGDQGAKKVAAQAASPRVEVKSREVDPLRDPGRKRPAGAPKPLFTDVTKQVGLDSFRQFQGARSSQLPEDMGSGLAWGDFDNDGYDDLFVVSGGGAMDLPEAQRAPSVLYRNLGNGRFEKVQDFPELRILGMGAAWGDYNNDGWLDLVVTGYNFIALYRNDHGHLVREKTFPSPKGFWTGVSWGDYNRDGYLDLYVCGYVKYVPAPKEKVGTSTQQFGLEVPFTLNPASYEPERNLLFRNNGNGTFTEVAGELGVSNPEGRSLSALWHDFDGDGWLDLYVANDVSENKLYLNRSGKFVDAGRSAWVEEYRGSMGLAAGDFDRDGDDDLFISHWVAQQYALYQNLSSEQKKGSGGKPELHFTDVAEMKGVGQPSLQSIGWGTAFVDFDSDGWPDLVVANGSTFEQKETRPRRLVPMPSFLFWNARGEFFYDLAPWNRSFAQPHVSRGLAVADYDNDGSMDIAVVDQGEGVRLLRNDVPHGNWIEFRLHSRPSPNKAAIGFGDGATAIAWVNGVPLRRTVTSASYLSQASRRVHIGLGPASKVDKLEVRWLGGKTEMWTAVEANRIWDVTQGERELKVFEPVRPAIATRQLSKEETARFWERQRLGMDAMKREGDHVKAAQLFREALAINPAHEDSHYYLANCLASQGDITGAIAELDALARINPESHRAFQRKGELLAASEQLTAAQGALESALRLNPEETGTLLLLGEVGLAKGDLDGAQRRFEHACQANPRAGVGWFLRGYIAWKRGNTTEAAALLNTARNTRGKDWKPSGAVAEGDVQRQMHRESGFLTIFEQQWNGDSNPPRAYAALDELLRGQRPAVLTGARRTQAPGTSR
jgi:tetratricopeptide (TPR) repeat protein